MKRVFRAAFLLSPLALLGACASSDSASYTGTETAPYTEPAPLDPNAVQPAPGPTTPGAPSVNNPAPRRSVTNEPKPWDAPAAGGGGSRVTYPTAQSIAGKPGLVKSPYAPYAGEVDVKGIPSGTTVKCPYSGKIFIVP